MIIIEDAFLKFYSSLIELRILGMFHDKFKMFHNKFELCRVKFKLFRVRFTFPKQKEPLTSILNENYIIGTNFKIFWYMTFNS